jgi:hypothetical protein
MSDLTKPLTQADSGYELCYECDGSRLCWSCRGAGRRSNGDRCNTCAGRGLCLVCNGGGELPIGTKARLSPDAHGTVGPPATDRKAQLVGRYRELGFEDAPSLEPLVRTGSEANRDRAVAYLKAGKTLILTPSALTDIFDQTRTPGSRSILTDGTFAWSAGLAYYIKQYGLPVPGELEQHMERNGWVMPVEINLKGLGVIGL